MKIKPQKIAAAVPQKVAVMRHMTPGLEVKVLEKQFAVVPET